MLDITVRQLEILRWVDKGKTAPEIADILGISYRTVEHHLEAVCQNLGVKNRYQAVALLREVGLISEPPPWTSVQHQHVSP